MPQAAPKMSDLRAKPKDTRPSSFKRGYGHRWQKIRHNHLASNPLCVECNKMNITKLATVVDHITPHKGNMTLFYDKDNLQSLCELHHNKRQPEKMVDSGIKLR